MNGKALQGHRHFVEALQPAVSCELAQALCHILTNSMVGAVRALVIVRIAEECKGHKP